jgi:hypothetical protein
MSIGAPPFHPCFLRSFVCTWYFLVKPFQSQLFHICVYSVHTVTGLISALPGNISVNTVQHITIEEAVFSEDPTDAPINWTTITWYMFTVGPCPFRGYVGKSDRISSEAVTSQLWPHSITRLSTEWNYCVRINNFLGIHEFYPPGVAIRNYVCNSYCLSKLFGRPRHSSSG